MALIATKLVAIRHLAQPFLRTRVHALALARKKFFLAIQFFSINLLFQRIYWSCMQKYENISELSPTKFKRLTGVRKDTFIERISIVKEAENKRMSRGGKPPHLGIEDRLDGSEEILIGQGHTHGHEEEVMQDVY
jgi:hypothetical protein